MSGGEKIIEDSKKKKRKLSEVLPKKVEIRRLSYPPTKSEVLVVGVDWYSYIHATLVKDILHELNPETVIVDIPCDEPYFVKNLDEKLTSFRDTWKFFTFSMENSFFVNPKPKYISDITLSKSKIDLLIKENIQTTPAEFEFTGDVLYSLDWMGFGNLYPDCYLTGINHGFNRLDQNISVVIGGYPQIILRDYLANIMSLIEVEESF